MRRNGRYALCAFPRELHENVKVAAHAKGLGLYVFVELGKSALTPAGCNVAHGLLWDTC